MNPFIMLEVSETPPMSALLSSLALVVTEVFKWITQVATTITNTPLLLLTTGFLVLGGTIGIFGRLLSKN